MTDEWERQLFSARYGGLDLDVLEIDDDVGRDVVVTTYPRRDGGHVNDVGASPRASRWSVVFYPKTEEESHLERLNVFLTLVHDGEAHMLEHPLTGSFEARPGPVTVRATGADRNWVLVNVTFHEHLPEPAAFQVGDAPAGANAVADAAAEVGAVLETDIGNAAIATVTAWEAMAGNARAITLAANDLANQIGDEIDRVERFQDVTSYPAVRALRRLRAAVERAADALAGPSASVGEHLVTATIPLLAIAQEVYGGAGALAGYGRLLEMNNNLADPLRVAAGTVLRVPGGAS